MYILTQWKDSLQLFTPKRLRLFLLVVLKSALSAIKLLAQYFWWMYALLLLVEWVSPHFWHTKIVAAASMSVCFVLFYGSLLALRPALERKDADYFYRYLRSWRIAYLGLLWVAPSLLGCAGGAFLSWLNLPAIGSLGTVLFLLYWPIIIMSCFFMLDAPLHPSSLVKSIWRGSKLVVHGIPIYLFFALYLTVLHLMYGPVQLWPAATIGHGFDPYANTLLASLIGWILVSFEFLLRHCVTVLFLSCSCMYYVKAKYEKYSFLYGNQTTKVD